MATTTTFDFPRSHDGKIFWYPDKLGHKWCVVHFVENEDGTGTIDFHWAETKPGGTALDVEYFIRGITSAQYQNETIPETLTSLNMTFSQEEVDSMFGNNIPGDFWTDWMGIGIHLSPELMPSRLVDTLNLIYPSLK